MGLHIRSAGSFHGFGVSRRDVRSCLEKDSTAESAEKGSNHGLTQMHTDKSEDTGMGLHIRSAGSFLGFRVSRRDVRSCLEKTPPQRARRKARTTD